MRVGVDAIANDYNPVANLIERATLEIPTKYGTQFYKDLEKGLNWIFNETKNEMEQFYPKHNGIDVVDYIWAWSVQCPECGFDNPLVGQWWLIRTDKKKKFIDPIIEGTHINYQIKDGSLVKEPTCTGEKGIV